MQKSSGYIKIMEKPSWNICCILPINDTLHMEDSSFLATRNISFEFMSKIRQRTQPKFEQVWKVISSVHLPMAWDHPTSVRPSDFSVNLNVNLLHRRVRHMFKLINFLHMVLGETHDTVVSITARPSIITFVMSRNKVWVAEIRCNLRWIRISKNVITRPPLQTLRINLRLMFSRPPPPPSSSSPDSGSRIRVVKIRKWKSWSSARSTNTSRRGICVTVSNEICRKRLSFSAVSFAVGIHLHAN